MAVSSSLLSTAPGTVSVKIHPDEPCAQRGHLFLGVLPAATEHCTNACNELAHTEGLGHEVIGPILKPLHAVLFFAARGEHDDGN